MTIFNCFWKLPRLELTVMSREVGVAAWWTSRPTPAIKSAPITRTAGNTLLFLTVCSALSRSVALWLDNILYRTVFSGRELFRCVKKFNCFICFYMYPTPVICEAHSSGSAIANYQYNFTCYYFAWNARMLFF